MTTPTTEDRYGPMPGELGRRFTEHAEENLRYLTRPLLDAAQVDDDSTNVWWPFPTTGGGPFPLDQAKEGGCTGWGSAHELAAGPIQVPGMTNAVALALYRRNQEEDRRAGRFFDAGATVAATCKALLADHRITGYLWNKGAADTIRALRVGPVALGIDWSNAQYKTGDDGLVTVDNDWVGGHFIVLAGRQVVDEPGLPPVVKRYGPGVWWPNTWGDSYGVALPQLNLRKGAGFVPDDTLAELLDRQGESVTFRDFLVAPEPAPVKPEPVPVPPVVPTPPPPGPTPAPPRRPRPGDPWAVWITWWKWQAAQRPGK